MSVTVANPPAKPSTLVTNGSIDGSSFRRADESVKHRLVLSIEGLEKEGKTHFGLTAPGPIAYLNFDDGLDGVIQKFQTDKQIHLADFSLSIPYNSNQASSVWGQFINDYKAALAANMKTIIIDTATEAWETLRIARFGKLTQVPEIRYTEVNSEYKGVIKAANESDSNLILLHQVKKEYKTEGGMGNWTGKYELAGFSKTGFLVQVKALAYKNRTAKGIDQFRLKILDCRQNPSVNGQELVGMDCNFVKLATTIFPDTEADAWTNSEKTT